MARVMLTEDVQSHASRRMSFFFLYVLVFIGIIAGIWNISQGRINLGIGYLITAGIIFLLRHYFEKFFRRYEK